MSDSSNVRGDKDYANVAKFFPVQLLFGRSKVQRSTFRVKDKEVI